MLNLKKQFKLIGLSGHLRIAGEEKHIESCISSVIDALDELIITVQPTTLYGTKDNEFAYAICSNLAKKYDKIKLYFYPHDACTNVDDIKYSIMLPPFYNLDIFLKNRFLSPKKSCFLNFFIISTNQNVRIFLNKTYKFYETLTPQEDSQKINNIAHYYNFGLSKCSYKYYMKIDLDQIYFAEKIKKLKKIIFKKEESLFSKILYFFGKKKSIYILSGLNLTLQKGDFRSFEYSKIFLESCCIPISQKIKIDTYNWSCDHFIIALDKKIHYEYSFLHGYEILIHDREFCGNFGIFWLHYGYYKRSLFCDGNYGVDFITLKNYLKLDLEQRKKIFENINLPKNLILKVNILDLFENDKKHINELLNNIS